MLRARDVGEAPARPCLVVRGQGQHRAAGGVTLPCRVFLALLYGAGLCGFTLYFLASGGIGSAADGFVSLTNLAGGILGSAALTFLGFLLRAECRRRLCALYPSGFFESGAL